MMQGGFPRLQALQLMLFLLPGAFGFLQPSSVKVTGVLPATNPQEKQASPSSRFLPRLFSAEPQASSSPPSSSFTPDIEARVVTSLEPGCVMVAKPWEYNHFYHKACLFVYQVDEERGSRAVIMERPTAFTLSDLAPAFINSPFANHTVFLGGDYGGDVAIVLHPYASVQGAKPVGGGMYYGGLRAAESMLREQRSGARDHGLREGDFKFFFNYGSWTPGQLQKEVSEGKWDLVELAPSSVLRQGADLEERTLWPYLRRHYLPKVEEPPVEGQPPQQAGEGLFT